MLCILRASSLLVVHCEKNVFIEFSLKILQFNISSDIPVTMVTFTIGFRIIYRISANHHIKFSTQLVEGSKEENDWCHRLPF